MVVVSHLSLFLGDKIRGRCDSHESHLPLIKTIYFPIAPLCGHAGAGELLVQPAKFQWREPGVLFKDGDEMAGV